MINFTQNVSARFAAGAIGVAMIVSLGLGAAAPALAAGLTTSQVNSILSLLQSFGADQTTINNVQASLNGQPTTGTGTVVAGTTFTRTLQVGSTGADVKALQQVLNSTADTQVAKTGAGSPGMESMTFGPATKAAVMKFQTMHSLSPVGMVGPATRAILNGMGGAVVVPGTTPVVSGPGITVSMAPVQPVNTLAPQNATRVPFTTFTLSNNTGSAVVISGVTVQRAGLAQDAAFSGVVLLDQNGLQVGLSHTFNSNHQATIGDNFTLGAGQAMTYTVAANMAASLTAYTGQVAQMQVVAVNTTVPVSGSLPIIGASQTINSTLAIGQYSTSSSSYDPGSNQTKSIGDTNIRFAGIRLTANSAEDLKLYSLRWRQVGTAGASDFSNVRTYIDGTSYPTTMDVSGKYYTTVFPNGLLIAKGGSSDAYIVGDITGTNAAARTVVFDLDKSTDVYFVGQTYGYGAVSSSYATAQPWFHTGYTTTINAGSASVIQNATSVASANIPVNVSNTVLGGFQTSFFGKPVSITGISFAVATSSGATGGLMTNISLVNENGAVIAGPVDQPATATNGDNITFTDTITFPVGLHTYTLKGKVPSAWANGSTVVLSTTADSAHWLNATGQTSGNTVSMPGTVVTMNTMTVKGAYLTVTASPTPTAQTIVPGTGLVLGNIQLDASQSGEDVRINNIKLMSVGSLGANVAATKLNTCQLFNGATALNTGTNVVNTVTNDHATLPDVTYPTTFTFDSSLTVPKGTVMTLAVKCNIASGGTNNVTYAFGVFGGATVAPSAIGVQSGSSLVYGTSEFVTTGVSGLQTVATGGGSLAMAVDASSPSYALVPAGTNGVTVGVVKMRASNESITLQKIGLTLTAGSGNTLSSGSGASTNGGVSDLNQIYIYQGSTLVGTAQFTGVVSGIATSTLTTPIVLAKDTDVLLTIKADLAGISVSSAGGIGDVIKVDPLNAQGAGASSGQTINSAATAAVAGIAMFKSYPTLANVGVSCTNSNSCNGTAQVLKKFTITANAAGSVGIYQIAAALATSSATVRNMKLFAYTDSGYSLPANVANTTGGQFGSTAVLGAVLDTAAPTVSFIQTTPLQIPGGTTLYFMVVGDVAVVGTATNWMVGTTILGDTASSTAYNKVAGYNTAIATLLTTRTQSVAGVSTTTPASSAGLASNLIWSGNSTTTATGLMNDWANGYYVPGLSSNGF